MEAITENQSRILQLLRENARHGNSDIAEMLGLSAAEVEAEIKQLERKGIIVGYTAMLDPEKHEPDRVTASIEVRITPERGGGFDRIAKRIANFPQVKSCYLMSGPFDLWVVVESKDLREVARFVSEKLSTLEGVIATATLFQLKTYKENGHIYSPEASQARLAVAP